jgi:phytoene desaturase
LVIGAGVGGLSAAIHARLRGYDVLVLERAEGPGGKARSIETHGFRLDPGPSIVILTRLYDRLFRDAGRRMEDYLRFRRLDPFSRVYFEGRPPFDLPADAEACLAALDELAPQDGRSFRELLKTLDDVAPLIDRSIFARPYLRPWQLLDPNLVRTALRFDVRSSYREMVDRMFGSPVLRAFFYGFPSYGGQTYDSKAPGALMIPYLMVREGVWYPEGGVGAIPAALHRLATEIGVEFRFSQTVAALEARGGRALGARLADGEWVAADAFISNVDRSTTGAWLGRRDDRKPSLSYFTVHWGIRRLIEGLEHHTLTVPADFEQGFDAIYRRTTFPQRPIVYLNATHGIDPDVAPPGCSNLFAVVTTPACDGDLDWERDAPHYGRAVRRELATFGLGFEDDEIVFERVQTPLTFESQHGNYRGSLYGVHESHRQWGLFPLSNQDQELSNLFYCGGSVQPGAGLPMVLLSGRFAASLLP